jgi:hypothetical protein
VVVKTERGGAVKAHIQVGLAAFDPIRGEPGIREVRVIRLARTDWEGTETNTVGQSLYRHRSGFVNRGHDERDPLKAAVLRE